MLRNRVLRAYGDALAAACFARIEEAWPNLRDRYGERGRQYTAEDNYWHLGYLDTADSQGDPTILDRYGAWLTRFFVARGMEPEHIFGTFRILAGEIRTLAIPDEWSGARQSLLTLLKGAADRLEADAPTTPNVPTPGGPGGTSDGEGRR